MSWKKVIFLIILLILAALIVSQWKFVLKIFKKKSSVNVTQSISMNHSSVKEITNIDLPISIVKDSKGNFVVCDFSTHNVIILDKNFTIIKQLGGTSKGGNPGEFTQPHAVDFDADGNLYITDYGNKRIQKFSPKGDFLSILNIDREIAGPATAYFDKNYNLYISDYGSNSVIKTTLDGKFLGWIGAKTDGTLTNGWELTGTPAQSALPGGFFKVHSIRFDTDQMMYVIDSYNNRVQRFSKDGKFLGWIGAKTDGTLTNGWELTGTAVATNTPGGFNIPVAMDFINGDELAILEYGNPRVQRFSKDGKFLGWFGGTQDGKVTDGWKTEGLPREGSDLGAINKAYDIKIYENKMYIVDPANHRIQVVDFHN